MTELRAALETLARSEGAKLRPGAKAKQLDAAEKEVGFAFPPWLREVLLVCDGWEDGRLLRLGKALDVWRFYVDEGVEDAGWIGVDCVPFFDLHDGEFLVFRSGRDEVFEFAHDEGVTKKGTPFTKWLDGQVLGAKKAWAAREARAKRLAEAKPVERLKKPSSSGSKTTLQVVDVLKTIPFLIDDPEQPGAWTARVEPKTELEGTFRVPADPRTFQGVVRNGLLRLKPDGGPAPRWSKKTVVEVLGSTAVTASDDGAHASVAEFLEGQVKAKKLDPARLEVAAVLGHPGAVLALTRRGKRPPEASLERVVEDVASRGRAPAVRVAIALAYAVCELFAFDEALDEKLRAFLAGDTGSLGPLRELDRDGPAARALGLVAESLVAKDAGEKLAAAVRLLTPVDASVESALRAALRGIGPWALGLKPKDDEWPDLPWDDKKVAKRVKVVVG